MAQHTGVLYDTLLPGLWDIPSCTAGPTYRFSTYVPLLALILPVAI